MKSNNFDGMETVPISDVTKQAIAHVDAIMKEANLPTYTDLLGGIEKLIRRSSPGMRPVTVDWLHEHITPLKPR